MCVGLWWAGPIGSETGPDMCWASGLARVGEDRVRLKSLTATIPPNIKPCFSVPCLDKLELIAAVSMVINFFPVRQEEAPIASWAGCVSSVEASYSCKMRP